MRIPSNSISTSFTSYSLDLPTFIFQRVYLSEQKALEILQRLVCLKNTMRSFHQHWTMHGKRNALQNLVNKMGCELTSRSALTATEDSVQLHSYVPLRPPGCLTRLPHWVRRSFTEQKRQWEHRTNNIDEYASEVECTFVRALAFLASLCRVWASVGRYVTRLPQGYLLTGILQVRASLQGTQVAMDRISRSNSDGTKVSRCFRHYRVVLMCTLSDLILS